MSFYGLRAEPFGITPDPRFLFLSAAHREALAALVYGVSQRKGFISIIGEVGTGKTIILRAFLERIDQAQTTAICLLNPLASFEQIVQEILPADFTTASQDQFRSLQEWLIEEYRQGRNVVVVVDEAQRMSPATLERLRLLSNLETAEHKLIQVVLAGQPELGRKLEQPNLRQLRQRIAVRAAIWPLNRAESVAYINHRLSKVLAPGSESIFTRSAVNHLVRCAKGNPRRLNILCDGALVAGFSYQKRPVPWSVAWEASSGTTRMPRWGRTISRRTLAAITLLFAASLLGYSILDRSSSEITLIDQGWDLDWVAAGDADRKDEVDARPAPTPASMPSPDSIPDQRGASGHSIGLETAPERIESSVGSDGIVNAVHTRKEFPSADLPDKQDVMDTRLAVVPKKVVVNEGDGLWQLCRSVYGTVDSELVRFVMQANPHIQDPDELAVGEEVVFPSLTIMDEPVRSRTTDVVLKR